MFCDSDKCCVSKQTAYVKKSRHVTVHPCSTIQALLFATHICLNHYKEQVVFLVTHFYYVQLSLGLFPMKSRAEPLVVAFSTHDQSVVEMVKENLSSCLMMNFLNSWLQEI